MKQSAIVKGATVGLVVLGLIGCLPEGDARALSKNNSGAATAAMNESVELGDLLRANIEDAIVDVGAQSNSLPYTTGAIGKAVSIPDSQATATVYINKCGTGEDLLELKVWTDHPTTGSNTARLTATEDCTYQDQANTVIKAGSTVDYRGTSVQDGFDSSGSFELVYNFELYAVNGAQTAGARNLFITGEHESTLILIPFSYSGTSTNTADGEVYSPGLAKWLEVSTPTAVVSNYELSEDSFFNRSAGEHRLDDDESNFVSVRYSIDEENELQVMDFNLNNNFEWQTRYGY